MPAYAELLPDQLELLWSEGAAAIIPWGALEWHGSHLPLGLDGIVANWFSEQLSLRTNGVLLPAFWLPITTLPHQTSMQVRTETLRMVLDDVFSGLYVSGARTVCLVSGHYAQAHQLELAEAAIQTMEDYSGLRILTASPLELLGDQSLLDHAAQYETAQLQSIRPDLVHLEFLSPSPNNLHQSGVLGLSPSMGTPEEGASLLEAGLDAWVEWIRSADAESLTDHYRNVFDTNSDYVNTYYRGSWEDAIKAWWTDKGAEVL